MPIIGVITSALEDEKDLESATRKQREDMIARSKAATGGKDTVSVFNNPNAAGYAKIGTP